MREVEQLLADWHIMIDHAMKTAPSTVQTTILHGIKPYELISACEKSREEAH